MRVKPGTYSGPLLIFKQGISLVGQVSGDSRPILDGRGQSSTLVTILQSNVTVNSFVIRDGQVGVFVNCEPSPLRGVEVSNNEISGMRNHRPDTGVGILFWGDCDEGLILRNQVFGNDRQGIFVGYTDDSQLAEGTLIAENQVSDNGNLPAADPESAPYGIQLHRAPGTQLLANQVGSHQGSGAGGIFLAQSPDSTVAGNLFTHNSSGLLLEFSELREVSDNHFASNGIGLDLYRDTGSSPPLVLSQISFCDCTRYAIRNNSALQIDARECWWDSPGGPLEPTRTSCSFQGEVDFEPWLDEPPALSPCPATSW